VEDLSLSAPDAEPSESVRLRVQAARRRQLKRYAGTGLYTNAQLDNRLILEHCPMSDSARNMLLLVTQRYDLTPRSHFRIIKVARTIADLAASDLVEETHIAEAVRYRMLDESSLV
jgi:magnesium chelatase family protein